MKYSFILVRGLIREAAHWGSFMDELKKTFPESTFNCIDIPGAGIHFKKTTPLSIHEIVKEMREDFKSLNLPKDKPVVLMAVSLGGMIAAQWLKDFSKDFQYAILINTSYGDFSPVWKRLKPQALAKLIKVPTLKGLERERRILEVVSNRDDKYDENAKHWHNITMERPVSLPNTIRQLVAATKFKTEGMIPKIPVLLLGAPQDRMVDVSCTRAIAKAWNAPAIEHPTAGHDLTTDDPQWTAQTVHGWFESFS